jgi:sulfate permease, SulP family
MANAGVAAPAPVAGNRWAQVFPILGWLPTYKPSWFSQDLMAGLIITCLLVPEGMAYAQIAGMPPQTVFYVAPPALLLYAIFASSNKLVVVVSATQAALSAATIAALAAPGSTQWMELTAALALLAGVITFAAGILRLGVIAQFFSPSVLVGFVSGLALTIAIKQVPKILGIEAGEGDFWERLLDIVRNLGATNTTTLLVGAIAIGIMVGVERFAKRLPAALIALIVGIALSRILGLEAQGVEVVAEIPSGLVGPQIPDVSLNDLYFLAAAAFGIFLVNFAEANSVASEFARRDGRKLDSNKELEGLGAANMGAGLFQGFAVGASLSKSAAADEAGGHTQMAGMIAAVGAILVALFLTGLFTGLPEATLGGIVIVAVAGMIKAKRIRQLWSFRKTDFMLAVLALLAVLTFETLAALVFAVGLSIVILVIRAADAPITRLGQQSDGRYVALSNHPDARPDASTLVVRLDSEMFFANADGVIDDLYTTAIGQQPTVTAVVLAIDATFDIDVPSCDALETLAKQLKGAGIRFALARVHPSVVDLMGKTGAAAVIGRENFFADVDDAVRAIESAGEGQPAPKA